MKLNDVLTKFREDSDAETPADVLEKMAAGIRALEQQRILEGVRQTGETMLPFSLASAKGAEVSLAQVLVKGPAVISFTVVAGVLTVIWRCKHYKRN